MIHNLLPTSKTSVLRREYWLRLSTLVALFLSALTLASIFLLFPSLVLSLSRHHFVERERSALLKSAEHKKSEEINTLLVDTKKRLATISADRSEKKLLTFVSRLNSHRGAGIQIFSLSLGELLEDRRAVVVVGTSRTREALVDFVRRMQGDSSFSGVEVPISNFAKRTDIGFQLNFSAVF